MTSDLFRAVERLHLGANGDSYEQDECIISLERPKKQTKGDTQGMKRDLERDFLTPQTSFDLKWLNKIQQ